MIDDILPKINPTEISIELINEKQDLSHFTSYEPELVEFLKDDALENQNLSLSLTFLWYYQHKIAGYITLLTDRIILEGDLKEFFHEKEIHYKSLPALKIGRLCIDNSFLKRGLGRLMVLFAVEKAKEITLDKAGCRFLTVDAKNSSTGFYQKMGFKILEKRLTGTAAMYLDILKPCTY